MILPVSETTQQILAETLQYYAVRIQLLEADLHQIDYARRKDRYSTALRDQWKTASDLLKASKWLHWRIRHEFMNATRDEGMGCTVIMIVDSDCETIDGMRVASFISFRRTKCDMPDIGTFKAQDGGICGAWVNHGTPSNPSWGSHT